MSKEFSWAEKRKCMSGRTAHSLRGPVNPFCGPWRYALIHAVARISRLHSPHDRHPDRSHEGRKKHRRPPRWQRGSLDLARRPLDKSRWDYYREIGFDESYARSLAAGGSLKAAMEYCKPFEVHAVERHLAECRARAWSILAPVTQCRTIPLSVNG